MAISYFKFFGLCFILICLFKIVKNFFKNESNFTINNKNCIITGGSSGLGLALAKLLISKNCRVLIVSRNIEKLKNGKNEIIATIPQKFKSTAEQRIFIYSLDVRNAKDCNSFANLVLKETNKTFAVADVDCLFCCAGQALPGAFLNTPLIDFTNSINLNYLGAVNITKAILPLMLSKFSQNGLKRDSKIIKNDQKIINSSKNNEICQKSSKNVKKNPKNDNLKKNAIISFVGSTLSLIAIPGYSSYTPSKWALKGFCESLQSEFSNSNVKFSIFMAPSMDTAGFAVEQRRKPLATKIIEGNSPQCPLKCAEKWLEGISKGHFFISCDFVTNLLLFGENDKNYEKTEKNTKKMKKLKKIKKKRQKSKNLQKITKI